MVFLATLEQSRQSAAFAQVTRQQRGAVKWDVRLPGHDGRRYQVLLRYEMRLEEGKPVGVVTGECLLDPPFGGQPACPSRASKGNKGCYHLRAALVAVSQQRRLVVYFCDSPAKALKLVNLGGKLLRYGRHDTLAIEYAVVMPRMRR